VGQLSGARAECIDLSTLAAFAEGLVEPRRRGRIDEHLAECAECRTIVARAVPAMPSAAEGSRVERPDGSAALGEDTDALAPGTRVGRYVVERRIGRGGMGAVYAANDPDLNRRVAVKVLRAEMLSTEARQQMGTRLLREAQAMARLCHPDVIIVYDVGTFRDQLFVAMEYVDAGTLRQWRAAKHRTYAEMLAIYERAGSGLAAAHEAGLVHRDFKPDNVLVGSDGRVRVTDFGLARSLVATDLVGPPPVASQGEPTDSRSTTTTLTATGALIGTPAYMAPEQLRGEAVDARSDIFSFCVALYEALYGERPFDGSSVVALRAAVDRGVPRPAPTMTLVPQRVRAALLRGLRAAPEERFASMRELLGALRAGQARSRRRRTVIAGIAVAMGILAAGGALVRRAPLRMQEKEVMPISADKGGVAMPPRTDEPKAADVPAETTVPAIVRPAPSAEPAAHDGLAPRSSLPREPPARAAQPRALVAARSSSPPVPSASPAAEPSVSSAPSAPPLQARPPKLGTNAAPILP
jgi:serine/threonine protein kinase